MTTQHIETLIIGAGQAGLSTGYHLQRLGRPFLIVDGNERIGDNWRHQWDTLKLYSPAKYDGLPGLPFPAPPWSFPGKERGGRLPREATRIHADLPVRMSTRVERLEATRRRRIHREPGGGHDHLRQRRGRHRHLRPDAERAGLRRATSTRRSCSCTRASTAVRPSSPTDPVLVVGASHSGCDIAYEAAEHLPTTLAGRDRGQIPVRWESRALRYAFPVLTFVWRHVLTRRTPIGRKEMPEIRHHGGPMLRVKRDDLRRRGVERVLDRVTGVSDGRPVLDDGRVVDASHRRLVHRLQAGLRLDRRPGLRRGRLPARSTAASSTRCPGCSSADSPSSTPSAPWCSWASAGTPSTSPAGSTRAARPRAGSRPPDLRGDGPRAAVGILRRKGGARWVWSTTWLGPGRPTSGGSGSRPTTRSRTSTRPPSTPTTSPGCR